jgi:hypothetical protein
MPAADLADSLAYPSTASITTATAGGDPSSQHEPDIELPEPGVLAALLLAIESDRREIVNRVASAFEEEVEAVAHLYWPFLLVRGQDSPGAAVFDLAGVWKQEFTYSFMPESTTLQGILEGGSSPDEFQARVRKVVETFGHSSGTETLNVEGFVPLAAPLQLELLGQTLPHAEVLAHGSVTLPTRHSVGWYRDEIARMRQWLARLDSDLQSLRELRVKAEGAVALAQATLDQDRAVAEAEALGLVMEARRRAHQEIDKIQQAHHTEVLHHLEEIDGAHRTVAVGETTMMTSDTLAERAAARREDPAPHHGRARGARLEVRDAKRKLAESQRAIELIHERQRRAQEAALEAVISLERSNALAGASHDLLRDQVKGAGSALLQCIDGQIAARQAQKETLSGFFLPLPAPVVSRVVWLPVWAVTFRNPRGIRQLVFPPLKARPRIGVGGSLKRLFGGIVLPVEPRTTQFDREFRSTVQQALAKDPWLSQATQELTQAANILRSPEVPRRLKEGLEMLRRNEWISAKQATEFYEAFVQQADRRRLRETLPPAGRESVPARVPGVGAGFDSAAEEMGDPTLQAGHPSVR